MEMPAAAIATDAKSAEVQKTPNRISLAMIKDRIAEVEYIHPQIAPHMTLCLARMSNGYVLVGHSAPADPENFNEKLGEEFALNQAINQAWPLLAFELLSRLSDPEVD